MKDAIVSNMLTSTSWPSPVRSRWNSAIIVAYSAVRPATLSATMVPTYVVSPVSMFLHRRRVRIAAWMTSS